MGNVFPRTSAKTHRLRLSYSPCEHELKIHTFSHHQTRNNKCISTPKLCNLIQLSLISIVIYLAIHSIIFCDRSACGWWLTIYCWQRLFTQKAIICRCMCGSGSNNCACATTTKNEYGNIDHIQFQCRRNDYHCYFCSFSSSSVSDANISVHLQKALATAQHNALFITWTDDPFINFIHSYECIMMCE